jgi:hypothetical protein
MNMEKFWKLALQANMNNTLTPTPTMEKIMASYPKMDTAGIDEPSTIIDKPWQSKETYRDAITKGKELRHEFLLKEPKYHHWTTTKHWKQQSNSWYTSKPPYRPMPPLNKWCTHWPGLTSIWVPTDDGSNRTVIDSIEVKDHLINRNREHYAQAEHTAMAHHLIQEKLGVLGTTDFCNQVLAGTADLSITLQAIFQQLHWSHSLDISGVIDFDDFKDVLHKWKESTSTLPSGRHIGH